MENTAGLVIVSNVAQLGKKSRDQTSSKAKETKQKKKGNNEGVRHFPTGRRPHTVTKAGMGGNSEPRRRERVRVSRVVAAETTKTSPCSGKNAVKKGKGAVNIGAIACLDQCGNSLGCAIIS